jgi:hypothetical protein
MGRFLFVDRATWYFGGESSIWGDVGPLRIVGFLFRKDAVKVDDGGKGEEVAGFLLLEDAVKVEDGGKGEEVAGLTCLGFLGRSDCGRLDGSMGFGAIGCALSASVAASAAARSAARAGEGASEEGAEGSEGVADGGGGDDVLSEGVTGSRMYQ